MIAAIELSYGWENKFKRMTETEWVSIRDKLAAVLTAHTDEILAVKELPEPAEGWPPDSYRRTFWLANNHLIDLNHDGRILAELGVNFTVKRFKAAYRVAGTEEPIPGTTVNYTIQVAIPDLGLLAIKSVQVVEDICTNELQRLLNAGWRILAVCPPCAQRRPDYILGHTGENM